MKIFNLQSQALVLTIILVLNLSSCWNLRPPRFTRALSRLSSTQQEVADVKQPHSTHAYSSLTTSWQPVVAPALKEVTDQDFESQVLSSDDLSLVYFTSPWNKSPMGDVITQAMLKRSQQPHSSNTPCKFFQLDTDANIETVTSLNVRFVPSFGVFRKGKMLAEVVGVVSPAAVQAQIDRCATISVDSDVMEEDDVHDDYLM